MKQQARMRNNSRGLLKQMIMVMDADNNVNGNKMNDGSNSKPMSTNKNGIKAFHQSVPRNYQYIQWLLLIAYFSP